MGRFSHAGFLLFAISTTAAAAHSAQAQDRASIAERTPLDQIRKSDWARDNAREMANDWGTGGFAVSGGRAAVGRKRAEFLTPPGPWRRSYHAELRGWGDVSEGLALEAGLAVTRDSNGRIGAPLLVETSRGSSASASLALRGDSGAALTITVFDRPGWTGEDMADTVNRMNAGEGPARSGAALAWTMTEVDAAGQVEGRLAVTLERASLAGGQAASTARVEARLTF